MALNPPQPDARLHELLAALPLKDAEEVVAIFAAERKRLQDMANTMGTIANICERERAFYKHRAEQAEAHAEKADTQSKSDIVRLAMALRTSAGQKRAREIADDSGPGK